MTEESEWTSWLISGSYSASEKKQKTWINELDLRDLKDGTKMFNICVTEVLEGKEKECGLEKYIWRKNNWKFHKYGEGHKLRI